MPYKDLEKRRAHSRLYATNVRKANKQQIRIFKARGCAFPGCCEKRIEMIECHHIDARSKLFVVCEGKNYPAKKLATELVKCLPLCKEHHRLTEKWQREGIYLVESPCVPAAKPQLELDVTTTQFPEWLCLEMLAHLNLEVVRIWADRGMEREISGLCKTWPCLAGKLRKALTDLGM